VINATVNDVPMQEGVDFYIRAGYDTFTHNIFVPIVSFAPGDVISITYNYPIADGAGGNYVGGNLGYDWTDTMFAYGYMYPVSISETSAALNRNPYFFMETIPKGEIDFRWNYIAGAKPRQGFFKIDILDVVKCTGAYCTRGDGVYNAVYLPGADLDDTDVCHIGILDLVTITGKYALTFGRPPTHSFTVVCGSEGSAGWIGLLGATQVTIDEIQGMTVILNITTGRISFALNVGSDWGEARGTFLAGGLKPWRAYVDGRRIGYATEEDFDSEEDIYVSGGTGNPEVDVRSTCYWHATNVKKTEDNMNTNFDPNYSSTQGRVTGSRISSGQGKSTIIYDKPDGSHERLKITIN
jgi:hypothetical protein